MIMNETMCQAYDYLMESKSDPDYLKVMKWAVSYEYNSPKPNEDGTPQPSHIGNYFSNILFKGASFGEKDCQCVLIYTGKIKSDMKYGSTKVTDLRTVTIEYHINGLEEIKYICKSEEPIIKALARNCPPGNNGAAILHDIARECVRNVVMYPENDKHDKYTFHNLATLGDQLVKCPLLPNSIKRTGERNVGGQGGYKIEGKTTAFTCIVPPEKRRAFEAAYGEANRQGINVPRTKANSNEQYVTLRWAEHNKWTANRTEDENGNLIFTVATIGEFAEAFMKDLVRRGVIEDYTFKQVDISKRGEILINGNTTKKSAGSASKGSKEGPSTSATLAFDADSFDRGAKLSNALVKRYMSSHPKGNATLDVNQDVQSVTFNGMSKGAIDDAIAFLKSKSLTFSKM